MSKSKLRDFLLLLLLLLLCVIGTYMGLWTVTGIP